MKVKKLVYLTTKTIQIRRFFQPPYTELAVMFMKFPTHVQTYLKFNKTYVNKTNLLTSPLSRYMIGFVTEKDFGTHRI